MSWRFNASDKTALAQSITTTTELPLQYTCKDDGTIAFGEFFLQNSVWGSPSQEHTQCIAVYPSGAMGWSWHKPSQSRMPHWPSVIYGKHPISITQGFSSTRNLPVGLGLVKSIEVSLDASVKATGSYNFVFDIWITNSLSCTRDSVTHEVMVWFLWTPGLDPKNDLGTVNDGYNTYQLSSFEPDIQIEFPHYRFSIAKQGIPSRINLTALLDYLTSKGEQLGYLAAIMLGNEVFYGYGQTTVRVFDVKILLEGATITETIPYTFLAGILFVVGVMVVGVFYMRERAHKLETGDKGVQAKWSVPVGLARCPLTVPILKWSRAQ